MGSSRRRRSQNELKKNISAIYEQKKSRKYNKKNLTCIEAQSTNLEGKNQGDRGRHIALRVTLDWLLCEKEKNDILLSTWCLLSQKLYVVGNISLKKKIKGYEHLASPALLWGHEKQQRKKRTKNADYKKKIKNVIEIGNWKADNFGKHMIGLSETRQFVGKA